MSAISAIEWTDATVNFWWGCTKVGPGCDHCYAETWAKRTGGNIWGAGVPRRKIASAVKLIHRLDNQYANWAADYECLTGNARAFGLPAPNIRSTRRVFVQSMSDLFDLEVPLEWFDEAWQHIEACNRLDIQIVTKRISAVEKRLEQIGRLKWPRHAGLIITVCNQAEADRDIPRLIKIKARLEIPWVGLSIEPMLGPINLTRCGAHYTGSGPLHLWQAGGSRVWRRQFMEPPPEIDWVICGGESGGSARPMHPDWVRDLRDQCEVAGVPFFFKQWGTWFPWIDRDIEDPDWRRDYTCTTRHPDQYRILNLAGGCGFHGKRVHLMQRYSKKVAGRLLDGREHNAMPDDVRPSNLANPAAGDSAPSELVHP